MNKEIKFEVGDIVEWCGQRGKVIKDDISHLSNGENIEVLFFHIQGSFTEFFTEDGKYYDWHKDPSLKLIEKAKRAPRELWHDEETGDSYSAETCGCVHYREILPKRKIWIMKLYGHGHRTFEKPHDIENWYECEVIE